MMLGIMKLVILSSMCLLSMAMVGKVLGERRNNTALVTKDGTFSSDTISKRGWGSVLVQGTTTLVRLGSLGVSLTSAITKGCAFYPSICTNLGEIERMERVTKKEKEEFKMMYVQHSKDVLDFRTVVSNNGMIRYYINDTMKKIESLSEWQSRNTMKLEAFFPKSLELEGLANKTSFEDYLLTLSVGRLEYTLSDIHNMLSNQQQSQLIGLAVQLLVEAAIEKFVTSIQTAYSQVYFDDIFSGSQLQEMLGGYEKKAETVNGGKLKVVPKVFKQMAKNARKYISSMKNRLTGKFINIVGKAKAIQKALATEGWKSLKGNLKSTLRKTFNTFKRKVTSLGKRFKMKIKSLKTFQMSKTQIGMSILSLVGDAVNIGLTIHAWKVKSDQIERAKENYKVYLNKLRKEKDELNTEIDRMKLAWETEIRTFKDTSKSFESIMRNLTEHSQFMDVVGLSKLAVNNTKSLSASFKNVSKDNIIGCQRSVIAFLKANDNNLTSINEALRARNILYDSVIRDSSKNKGVLQMIDFLHTLYRFDASNEVRRFGQKLRKKDVVCVVAIIRQDKTKYDYYPLLPFRPRCDVNETLFAEMEKGAIKQQNMKIMNDVIDLEFKNEPVIGLSAMLATIKKTYKILEHKSLTKFAKAITAQDVLCHIARKFETLSEYDYIPLSHFRNVDCSAISEEDLEKFKEKASKVKLLHQSMRPIMQMCNAIRMCPCISSISMMTGASQDDIKAVIKRMDPKRKTYCGFAGCTCIKL